ncbi:hypothetical protein [Nonomuraea sp. NPDC023979]|uniref:hypothetical protein n=1 Tax=Nonomuraea sp. NPDC023979 TaxID=3154796 RepID=UPI00340C1709
MTASELTSVRGRHYPAPPPGLDGETDAGYTNRLLSTDGPYNHHRFRECALGFHRTCSCNGNKNGGCGCPHHSEPLLAGPMHAGAATLAELWYLPDATADRVMRIAAPLVEAGSEGAVAWVREQVSAAYQSDIGDSLATDVVSILLDVRSRDAAARDGLRQAGPEDVR